MLVALLALVALQGHDPWPLVRAVAGMALYLAGFLVIVVASGGALGVGDVKLAGVLGLALGWLGWPLLVGDLLGLTLAALFGLAVIVGGGMSSRIPLGPFLLVGARVAIVVG